MAKPSPTHIVHVLQGKSPVSRTMLSARYYTRVVYASRGLLWVLLAGIMGVVVWIAADNNGESGQRLVFSNLSSKSIVQDVMDSVMTKPHYQGMDAHNQPYTVVADTAVQKDKDTVLLDNVRADMTQQNGTWLALNAGKGELNSQTKQMQLTDGVDMFYDGGYEFRSDHAQVDIRQGNAYGDSPVEGQGPSGTIKADRFEVLERGQKIKFNGSVRMKLYR